MEEYLHIKETDCKGFLICFMEICESSRSKACLQYVSYLSTTFPSSLWLLSNGYYILFTQVIEDSVDIWKIAYLQT